MRNTRINSQLNHYPLLASAFEASNAPAEFASKFCLAFTLPPNMAFLRDGVIRCLNAAAQSSASKKLAQEFGCDSVKELREIAQEASKYLHKHAAKWHANIATADLDVMMPENQAKLLLSKMGRKGSLGDHPLRGYAISFTPIWSVLFHNRNDDFDTGYQQLIEEYVSVSALYILEGVSPDEYVEWLNSWNDVSEIRELEQSWPLRELGVSTASRLRKSSMAIRDLSGDTQTTALKAIYPDHEVSLCSWVDKGVEKHPYKKREAGQKLACHVIRDIDLWLMDIYPERDTSHRRVPTSSERGPSEREPLVIDQNIRSVDELTSTEVELEDNPYFECSTEINVPDEDASELLEEGICPTEVSSPAIIHQILHSDFADASPATKAMLDARNLAQIRRQHQEPHFGWNYASLREKQEIARFLSDPNPSPFDQLPKDQRFVPDLLIRASIITGRRIDDLWGMAITLNTSSQGNGVLFNTSTNSWSLPIYTPDYSLSTRPEWERESRTLVNRLEIPDSAGFGMAIKSAGQPSGPLVTASQDAIREGIRAIADTIWTDRKLTEARMARLLRDALNLVTHKDLALNYMLTGSTFAHAQTTSYYSTLSHSHITKAYQLACDAVVRNRAPSRLPSFSPTDDEYFAGARYCPKTSAIERFSDALIKRMTRKPGSTVEQIARYHTDYTLYSYMLIGLVGALRGYRTETLQIADNDAFWMVSDEKMRNDLDRRVISLPEAGAQQFRNLQEHIDALQMMFPAQQRSLTKSPFTHAVANGRSIRFAPLTHSNWHALTLEYGLPMNSFRRYARTRLVELGAPPDLVDSMVGHWGGGLAPFDKYSSQPPCTLLSLARDWQSRLLTELNIYARKSHLRVTEGE